MGAARLLAWQIAALLLSGDPRACLSLVVGLNVYSHDTSVCILDTQGRCLFAGQKERLTRVKHDAGDAAELVERALESIGADIGDLSLVVSNNHHHRVAPFEKRLEWSVGMGLYPRSYLSPYNLFPGVRKIELSHHLAHAWGAAWQSQFDESLVVVMDGMGEKYQDMLAAVRDEDAAYFCDFSGDRAGHLPETLTNNVGDAVEGRREAESVYLYRRVGGLMEMKPVWKRWTRERSPPELYNHGFENMESTGAVYSRISSHIFGDWNSCGKVMGLAPWAGHWGAQDTWKPEPFMAGDLLAEDTETSRAFRIDWKNLDSLPFPNQLHNKELRSMYAFMAKQVQTDLENVAIPFFSSLRKRYGLEHACFSGGVALNSVLNGKLSREAGFKALYIPPSPGDEGIAVGCAAFGLNLLRREGLPKSPSPPPLPESPTNPRIKPFLPYTGSEWDPDEIEEELLEFSPWIKYRKLSSSDQEGGSTDPIVEFISNALVDGKVVAFFRGRSEFGPRALGCRSLLADPRDSSMVDFINEVVKLREDFRPFAPSCILPEAFGWFQGLTPSPYMSITAEVKEEKRAQIPAVCHVDGSARLQTLEREDNPIYYDVIRRFYDLTGVPMVLNTSFNIRAPIVDSPADALSTLLQSKGSISYLILGNTIVEVEKFPLDEELTRCIPFAPAPFLSEVTSKDDGEICRARIMPSGSSAWLELKEPLSLDALECCDGESSCAEIRDEILSRAREAGESADPRDAIKALEELYYLRLIEFDRDVR